MHDITLDPICIGSQVELEQLARVVLRVCPGRNRLQLAVQLKYRKHLMLVKPAFKADRDDRIATAWGCTSSFLCRNHVHDP